MGKTKRSSSSSSSSSSSDEKRKKKKKTKKKDKKDKKRQKTSAAATAATTANKTGGDEEEMSEETAARVRAERAAAKRHAEQIEQIFGYTDEDNPFGDPNLTEKFKWTAKEKKAGPWSDAAATTTTTTTTSTAAAAASAAVPTTTDAAIEELQQARQRRLEREEERLELERERRRLAAQRELGEEEAYEAKEAAFEAEQERLRAELRLREQRAKPIDELYAVMRNDVTGIDGVQTRAALRALAVAAPPAAIVRRVVEQTRAAAKAAQEAADAARAASSKTERETTAAAAATAAKAAADGGALGELARDVETYVRIDSADEERAEYWQCVQRLVREAVSREAAAARGVHREVRDDAFRVLQGKTVSELDALATGIDQKILEGVEVEYWQALAAQLVVQRAAARLHDIYVRQLARRLAWLEAALTHDSIDDDEDDDAEQEEAAQEAEEEAAVMAGAGAEEEDEAAAAEKMMEDKEEEMVDVDDKKEENSKTTTTTAATEAATKQTIPLPPKKKYTVAELFGDDDDDDDDDDDGDGDGGNKDDAAQQQRLKALEQHVNALQAGGDAAMSKVTAATDASAAGGGGGGGGGGASGAPRTAEAAARAALDAEMLGEDEESRAFAETVSLTGANAPRYTWQSKYRPRKPIFLNRVISGYQWNNYNRAHYSKENPPPKTVLGYRFNIFLPDLIDKSRAPSFHRLPGDDPDTELLLFRCGAPYEDIAFKIVRGEWAKGKMSGFRSQFDRGTLSLYFSFKRVNYRR